MLNCKMSFMDYNTGPVSSYRAEQAAGKFSNPLQQRDFGLQHSLLGGYGDLQNESFSIPRISHAKGLVRNKELTNFTPETFFEWRDQTFNHRNIGNPQLVGTSSKVCNMNPEMISPQFQNLIELGICQPVLGASSSLDASHHWRKVAEHGSPIISQGLATRFGACDENNTISSMGVKRISSDDVSYSPEQISSITVCSDADLRSDGEPFESGATFSRSSLKCVSQQSIENHIMLHNVDQSVQSSIDPGRLLENGWNVCALPFHSPIVEGRERRYSSAYNLGQVSGMIPEKPNFLSSSLINESSSSYVDLLQYQLQDLQRHDQLSQRSNQMQFDVLSKFQPWDRTTGNQCDTPTRGETSLELPQVPLEQQCEIQPQQSCLIQHVEAAKILDSSIVSQHKVLLEYANYKSLPQNAGRSQATFLKDLHIRTCSDKNCKCDQYRSLIFHYDTCQFSACSICRTPRQLSSTDTVHLGFGKSRTDLIRPLHQWDCNINSSSSTEDIQPPPKRMRLKEVFVSENEPSSVVCLLEDHPLRNEASSGVRRSSEGPQCNKETMKEIKRKQLSDVEDPMKLYLTTYDHIDAQRMKYDKGPVLSGELNNECKTSVTNDANAWKNRSICTNTSQGLESGVVPVLNEQPHCIQEKEESHFMLTSDPEECKAEVDSIKVAADDELKNTFENTKILAVSLTDCFTAEQIKEHIVSLNPLLDQHIIGEAKESTLRISVGENTCQLCSMDKLILSPPPIYCSCCNVPIKRNAIYYWTLDRMGTKLCFCTKCLKASHGSSISFQGLSFSKAELQKEKNNEDSEESWVQCDKCENWQHQVCALYNAKKDPDGMAKYICPICRLQEMKVGEHVALPTAFGAKDLPRTLLSDHIEQRLCKQLEIEREERAKKLGLSFDEVPGAADLVVRVVSSSDKLLKVKQQFLNIFPDEDYPTEFPYKSKVIILFQKIEGVDICLFVMYAQEFGRECGHPNRRCIYVSYLDSVKYFRPAIQAVSGEALRTFVYQEILIGYLDYCKKRGFATCYIWACPPQKGEDYIFYCHPENQKTPKKEKLVQWYKSMLRKARKDGVVLDYTNLYDNFFIPSEGCNTKITAARLPYFDGDFWSTKAEDVILKMEIECGGESEMDIKKLLTKRTLRAMGHKDLTADAAKDILLMQKLGQMILPVKEDFIIIHLLYTCMSCHEVISGSHWFCNQCKHFHLCSRCLSMEQNLNQRKKHTSSSGEEHIISEMMVNGIPADTAERDTLIENDIFESRYSFQGLCQANQYQFGTLRRAKHSSMMVLYHLHKQVPSTTGRNCSVCLNNLREQAGWHCETCPNFDVCTTCYYDNGEGCHNHKLIQLSPRTECGVNKYQARQQKRYRLQVLLDLLLHSSKCDRTKRNPCSYPRCSWLKSVFGHVAGCNIRASQGCEICKKIWSILRMHSMACKDSSCRVPRCLDIREHAATLSRFPGAHKRDAVKELDTD